MDTNITGEMVKQELKITRLFNASREQVWRALTDPQQLMRWWGPKNFTAPVCKVDLRVGGKYLFCMRSPEGQDYWSTGVYKELIKPERIVYTDSFSDSNGNIVPASYYKMTDDIPSEMLVTITLEDERGKTRLTLRHAGMPTGTQGEMAGLGWNESFDKLAESLSSTYVIAVPGKQELTTTYFFHAPASLVFKAYTDPKLIPQWWGPRDLTTRIEKLEVKKGGIWRYIQHDAAGKEYAFNGVYHEVTAPKRLVHTFEWEGMPGHILLSTVTLQEQNGMTKVIEQSVFQSVEDRDGMYNMGMESGAIESGERLAELLMKIG